MAATKVMGINFLSSQHHGGTLVVDNSWTSLWVIARITQHICAHIAVSQNRYVVREEVRVTAGVIIVMVSVEHITDIFIRHFPQLLHDLRITVEKFIIYNEHSLVCDQE